MGHSTRDNIGVLNAEKSTVFINFNKTLLVRALRERNKIVCVIYVFHITLRWSYGTPYLNLKVDNAKFVKLLILDPRAGIQTMIT